MFNPKRLSFAIRVILIFAGLIAMAELHHIIFSMSKRAEDLPFVISIAAVGVLWILCELAVFFGKIEVKPLVPKESKPLIKPEKDAPLHQQVWYYTTSSAYWI